MRPGAGIVIAGGGVAALEAAIALRARMGRRVDITLVAPDEELVCEPLSVHEPFAGEATPRLSLARLTRDLGLAWCRDKLAGVDRDGHARLEGGPPLAFERLLVATGAPRVARFPHATTFGGQRDVDGFRALLDEVDAGAVRRVGFVVPTGVAWSLPLYELALMTASRARAGGATLELTVVTPEDRPLGVFGRDAAAAVEKRLAHAGIDLLTHARPDVRVPGRIDVGRRRIRVECDRIVALPEIVGPRVAGLPHDRDGFLPIDAFGRVSKTEGVYAAGDGTSFPLKQGGIAAQQADVAAHHIAWSLGHGEEPEPFRPVLRGRLATGGTPEFMRRDVTARGSGREESSNRPLWWPATKIAARYLTAYLAEMDGPPDAIAPGVRRRAFIAAADDAGHEIPLRGYEYAGRWG